MPDDQGRFEIEVPGWDLYPDSKTYRLVQKRLSDRLEIAESGITKLEERRKAVVTRVEQRFFQAAA